MEGIYLLPGKTSVFIQPYQLLSIHFGVKSSSILLQKNDTTYQKELSR